jgi:hypothetical protein
MEFFLFDHLDRYDSDSICPNKLICQTKINMIFQSSFLGAFGNPDIGASSDWHFVIDAKWFLGISNCVIPVK